MIALLTIAYPHVDPNENAKLQFDPAPQKAAGTILSTKLQPCLSVAYGVGHNSSYFSEP